MAKSRTMTNTKPFDSLLSFLVAGAIVVQGSYFPWQYISLFILLCVFVLYIIKTNQPLELNIPIFFMSLIIGILYIISTVFVARDKYLAALETIKLMCFVLSIVVFSVKGAKIPLLKGIFNGSFIVSIIGIFAYLDVFSFAGAIFRDGEKLRMQSVLTYANVTALLAGIGFFIACYYFETCSNLKVRVKYFPMGFILLTAMVLTFSRGVMVLFLVLLIPYLILLKSFKLLTNVFLLVAAAFSIAYIISRLILEEHHAVAALLFLGSAAAVTFLFYILENYIRSNKRRVFSKYSIIIIISIFTTVAVFGLICFFINGKVLRISIFESTFIERFIYLVDSIKTIMHNPTLGLGPGNWQFMQFSYQTIPYYSRYAHDGYIQFALDAGIAAVLLFLSILAVYCRKSIKQYLKSKDRFYICSLVLVTFIALHSIMDVDLSFASVLLIAAGLISSSLFNEALTQKVFKPESIKRLCIRVTALVLIPVSLLYLSGQLLTYAAANQIKAQNYTNAINIYKVERFLRPFDGKVYVELAGCMMLEGSHSSDISAYLNRAYNMNQSEPAYLYEIIEYESRIGNFQKAYEYSMKLIALSSLDKKGYSYAFDNLIKMYENKIIHIDEFTEQGNNILALRDKANNEVSSLSKYRKKDSFVSIEVGFLKFFNEAKK